MLRHLLAHPLTRGLDIDDPATTGLRREIIRSKAFLHRIYQDWYDGLQGAIPPGPGRVLELGSGCGFLRERLPELVTSEVFFCPFVRVVASGHALPFRDRSIRGIVMTNVLHHVPEPYRFLSEAARTVRPGGVVAMIEPWTATRWSRFVFSYLHYEPVDYAADPEAPLQGGPLSGANSALPWIMFAREPQVLARRCPQWRLESVIPMMPLRYIVSGGVTMRAVMPGWTTPLWRQLERAARPERGGPSMFARIVLRRQEEAA
jgi:SAM-dependent methyltransferase